MSGPAEAIARDLVGRPTTKGIIFNASSITFSRSDDGVYSVIVDGKVVCSGTDADAKELLWAFRKHGPGPRFVLPEPWWR